MQTRNKTVGKNKTTPCDVRKQFEILQNEVRGGRVKYIKKTKSKNTNKVANNRWKFNENELVPGWWGLLGGGREFYCYFGEQMS